MTTESQGIFQPDIILRTALVEAMRDLRANPSLLDHVFNSLPNDPLTAKIYGVKEGAKAKEWFLKTDIPVHVVPKMDEAKVPCISIKLISSQEAEIQLGDVHFVPQEDNDANWPDLSTVFTPINYDPKTGVVTVPDSVLQYLSLSVGTVLIDANGGEHEIVDVPAVNQATIVPLSGIDLKNAVIKGPRPSWVMSMESAGYQETYQIGLHVSGDPVYMLWLHSIIVFILLRYKQALLEARGLQKTVFSSSDLERNEQFETEFIFSRYISLTGNVRHFWPKYITRKIVYVGPGAPGYGPAGNGLQVIGSGNLPKEVDPNQATWIGDSDSLGVK